MSTTPTHIARYTVVQPIAAGGMGEVFLARDDRLDRLVAIKLLRDGFDSEELRGRFEEEARNVAKLTHPNIVTIYEYGAHEGRPYIAMEYVAGHSLADLIRGKMPLPLARRVRLIEELCSGLNHAHKAHLVHRDVKPANLMVTTSGMLKVLDFGIAKLRGTDRTQAGMLVGTVNYMSPEQITGQPVDHRSDIFAVGLVLHEVLTYDQAFKGDLTTAMFNIVHGQPEALVERCPGLDPGFQTVVNRCLAKRREDRYHDLNLLKRDLARLRKPLDDDDTELADTIGLLTDDKTAVVPRAAPVTASQVKTAAGPDTRRALASAVAAGEAAIAAGQFESAVRHAEQALALEAGDAAALDLLDRARRAIDAARAASQVGHARAALQADHLDDARTALMTAAQLAPRSETVRDLAAQVERRAAELTRFDEAVRDARTRLGEGDFARARSLAETAVLIRPDDSDIQRLRAQIDRAAAAEAKRIADEAAREAERVAQEEAERLAQEEAERLVQERITADAARVAQEQRRAEDARLAEAERLAEEARLAEAERVERLERERRQVEAEAAAAAREAVLAAERAASAALVEGVSDPARAAETVFERAYWDAPTQILDVLGTRAPAAAPPPAAPPVSARDARPEHRPSQPRPASPAATPAAQTRRRLALVGGAAAVAVTVLVWAMRPAPTQAPADAPPVVTPVVTPGDTGTTDAEPPLNATQNSGPGLLPEFQRPLPNRPAGGGPADGPAATPATGGGTRPAPGPPVVPPAVKPVVPANTGPRPNVPQPGPPVTPPVTPAVTPVVTPANPGGSSTASGGAGAGGAPPVVNPPDPAANPVSPAGGTSTNPSAVVPAGGTTVAPPVAEAPAGRQLDETTIRRLVNAFGQAYQSKDLSGLKAVWPEMNRRDENDYRDFFNSYRTISWVTGDTNIRFDGERADARSAVRVTQRALRPDATTTQSRTYRFQFERRAKGWVLTGVENLGAAR